MKFGMPGVVYYINQVISLFIVSCILQGCVMPKKQCNSLCEPVSCEYIECEDCSIENDLVPISPEDLNPLAGVSDSYKLMEGDVLQISVYNDAEITVREAVIAPDGKLYYCMFDGVQAKGLTVEGLRLNIYKALQKYYQHPNIIICPLKLHDQTFAIVGAVRQPGVYPVEGSISLLQAIGRGGGVAYDKVSDGAGENSYQQENLARSLVDYKTSYLVRKDGTRLDVDFEKLLAGDPTQNVILQSGDTVILGFKEEEAVYVLGYVREPGRLRYTEGLNLVEAVAWSRGWFYLPEVHRGNLNKVLVIRGEFCHPCVIIADLSKIVRGEMLNLALEPGDIIYIPPQDFSFAKEVVRAFVFAFVQSFAAEAADYYSEVKWFPLPQFRGVE